MKINHKAIRTVIRLTALFAFLASIAWRLYNLMRHGGTLTKDEPEPEDEYVDDDGENERIDEVLYQYNPRQVGFDHTGYPGEQGIEGGIGLGYTDEEEPHCDM